MWTEDTATPTVTYRAPVNETRFDSNTYASVGTSDWAWVDRNKITLDIDISASATGSVDYEYTFAVDGPGHVGSGWIYLGSHERVTKDLGPQFTFVFPQGSTIDPSRSSVYDTLRRASRQLQVGGRDDSVTVFVGQPPMWLGGLSDNDRDMMVRGLAAVNASNNVWVHEYVHTRQDFRLSRDMRWFTEASAEYYAALLTYRQGGVSREEFRAHLRATSSGQLTDPTSWESFETPYSRGSRVLAALDGRLRRATDGNRTLMYVFQLMNQHEGRVTYDDFEQIVTRVGGEEQAEWLETYVDGSETPAVPENIATPGATNQSGQSLDTDLDGLNDSREIALGTDPIDADTDGDGLTDGEEIEVGTDPTAYDTDGDGLDDGEEVDGDTDPTTADTDGDGLDDKAEIRNRSDPTVADTDDDGLDDGEEVLEHGTDPTTADTDGDGLDDGEEVFDLDTDPTAADTDGDGLDDEEETFDYDSDPTVADTDDDGLADGAEIERGSDPTDSDTDDDGLNDSREIELGTDPTDSGTDSDSLSDGQEIEFGSDPTTADTDDDGVEDDAERLAGTDPRDPDTDGDGLTDGRERYELGTDPTSTDTDGDGISDREEVESGTDPTVPNGDAGTTTDSDGGEGTTDQTEGSTAGEGTTTGSEPSGPTATQSTTDGETPGFSGATGVLVLLFVALVVARRR